jgi:hypothetical protein
MREGTVPQSGKQDIPGMKAADYGFSCLINGQQGMGSLYKV